MAEACGIIRAVKRTDTLARLLQHKPELRRRFGVVRLALFGSRAREQAREDSAADVLVAFDGPADSARYFGVQFYLEDPLGCSVDLVTEKALRPQRMVIAVRKRLIHGDLGIDDDTLWSIVRDDLAPLREDLTTLIAMRP
jgi:hypothetical protein